MQKHEVKKWNTERWREFLFDFFLVSTFTGPFSGEPQTEYKDACAVSDAYRVKSENCMSC